MAVVLSSISAQVLYPDFLRLSSISGQTQTPYPYLNEGNETVTDFVQLGLANGYFINGDYKITPNVYGTQQIVDNTKEGAYPGGWTESVELTYNELVSEAVANSQVSLVYDGDNITKIIVAGLDIFTLEIY